MKNIFLFTAVSFILLGCGGGGGSSTSNSTYAGPMSVETQYTMFPGDSVNKDSENTSLKITHIDGKAESNIELVEGTATITRKQ